MSEQSSPLQLSGSLQAVPVADLARLLQSSRLSGCIYLEGKGCKGALYFLDGELVEAVFCKLSGVEALNRIGMMCRGTFRYEYGFALPSDSLGIFPTEELIRYLEIQMESARQLQELAPLGVETPRFIGGTSPEGFEFSQQEIALALHAADGIKSIRTLAQELNISELETSHIVARFRAAGLMELNVPARQATEKMPVLVLAKAAQ